MPTASGRNIHAKKESGKVRLNRVGAIIMDFPRLGCIKKYTHTGMKKQVEIIPNIFNV
jgi:hypothetical protein